MIPRLTTANENHWEREGTTEVVPSRTHRSPKVRIFTEQQSRNQTICLAFSLRPSRLSGESAVRNNREDAKSAKNPRVRPLPSIFIEWKTKSDSRRLANALQDSGVKAPLPLRAAILCSRIRRRA